VQQLFQLEVLLEAAPPLEDLLGLLGVLPEIGRGNAGVELLELVGGI
jgi:hypothetical protein